MTEPTVEIRPPRPDEVMAIAELNRDTWEVAYAALVPEAFFAERRAKGEDEERWRAALGREGRSVVVACEGDRVLGYASWTIEGDVADLGSIYVHPDAQGRGVGARLFRHAAEACREAAAARLQIWVLRDNERAQAFYRGMGARPTEARRIAPPLPELALPEVRFDLDLAGGLD